MSKHWVKELGGTCSLYCYCLLKSHKKCDDALVSKNLIAEALACETGNNTSCATCTSRTFTPRTPKLQSCLLYTLVFPLFFLVEIFCHITSQLHQRFLFFVSSLQCEALTWEDAPNNKKNMYCSAISITSQKFRFQPPTPSAFGFCLLAGNYFLLNS